MAEKLYQVLIQQESEETVDIVGSDSCNKNSGQNKGVHTSLEKRLRRPLQRILCLKHGVEIIWHRFFKLVGGETSGPSTLKGLFGKQIAGNIFYTMKIVNFQQSKTETYLVLTSFCQNRGKDAMYLHCLEKDRKMSHLIQLSRNIKTQAKIVQPFSTINPV